MNAWLPSAAALAWFSASALVLAITPGPGVLYVVTRTLAQGRGAGLSSVVGVGLGNLANAIAASLGLAALLSVSATAFTVLKLAGAVYLVWLGVQALRQRVSPGDDGRAAHMAPPGRVLRQGFMVALFNPKTALFFATFLPQFIDPAGVRGLQGVVLAVLFVAIAMASDSAYVLLAARLAPALRRSQAAAGRGRFVVAAVYLGLGAWAALSGRDVRVPSGS